MTVAVPEGSPLPLAAKREGFLSRIFLMRTRLREAQGKIQAVSARRQQGLACARKAKAAAELVVFQNRRHGDSEDLASVHLLVREGLWWMAATADHDDGDLEGAGLSSFERAWQVLDERNLLIDLTLEERSLAHRGFVARTLYEARVLPAEELLPETLALRKALDLALAPLTADMRALARVRTVRRLRWMSLLLVPLLTWGGVVLVRKQFPQINYALHRRVETSSTLPPYNSTSGVVDGITRGIGFVTKEETRPWVKIDLGQSRLITQVSVYNSDHCCFERAVPLVVQLSEDGESFRDVARRNEVFATWNADFPPTRARFVKLFIDGKNYLHLSEVTVQ